MRGSGQRPRDQAPNVKGCRGRSPGMRPGYILLGGLGILGALFVGVRDPTDDTSKKASVAATSTATPEPAIDTEADAREQKIKEQNWIAIGQVAVREKLKDGDSAKFRGTFFHRGSDGVPMSCGQVNARNSFGAYGGFERYVSGGSARMTFLESEVSDFDNVWSRLCQSSEDSGPEDEAPALKSGKKQKMPWANQQPIAAKKPRTPVKAASTAASKPVSAPATGDVRCNCKPGDLMCAVKCTAKK
jgi:hypothetical protein